MIGYSTINTTTLSISVMLPFLSLARANPQNHIKYLFLCWVSSSKDKKGNRDV